jgi:hypothetical protein
VTLSVGILSAQNSNFVNNQGSATNAIASPFANDFGGASFFINPAKEAMGSIYLYDDWEKTGVLYTNSDQRFVVENMNLNIQQNAFQVKISRDSIFTYYFNNIVRIEINNSEFKNYYSEEGKRIYEVIYESNDFSILKGFHIEFVTGSANPMVNRPNDRYIRKKTYYIWKDKTINPYKLRKKKILRLIEDDKDRVAKLEKFMVDNGLSYRNSDDIKKGLEYSAIN